MFSALASFAQWVASACTLKGPGIHSGRGHVPGLQTPPRPGLGPGGGWSGGSLLTCFSHVDVSSGLSLSLYSLLPIKGKMSSGEDPQANKTEGSKSLCFHWQEDTELPFPGSKPRLLHKQPSRGCPGSKGSGQLAPAPCLPAAFQAGLGTQRAPSPEARRGDSHPVCLSPQAGVWGPGNQPPHLAGPRRNAGAREGFSQTKSHPEKQGAGRCGVVAFAHGVKCPVPSPPRRETLPDPLWRLLP